MNIVIPYTQEPHSGLELRFALRSIHKHLSGVSEVFIVGFKPLWLTNVTCIPYRDEPSRPEYNVYSKMLAYAKQHTGDFVMWHDDHFLLKPLHVAGIMDWYNMPLSQIPARSMYKVTVDRTNALIGGNNYDIHTPAVFNCDTFVKAFSGVTDEICVKSWYRAHAGQGNPRQMDDCKINAPLSPYALRMRIAGLTFFSVGNYGITDDLCTIFNELYPEKSKYEC